MSTLAPVTPPTPDVPDIPIPSYTAISQDLALGLKQAGTWSSFWAAFTTCGVPLFTNMVTIVAGIVDDLLALAVKVLTRFQGTGTMEFFNFLAAMLSDLLGVELSATGMQSAFAAGGDISALQAAGGLLYDRLVAEFGTTGAITPDSGIAAAKRFVGFMLGFSVREANVSALTSLLPESLRFMDGIREYPVAMARNLGLGRLARRALQPLIQALISDPMTWYLNNQYRPKLLAESLAVHAWLRGTINEDLLNQILAWQGYSDAGIAAIKDEAYTRLPSSDYFLLNRWGQMTWQDMLLAIQYTGTSPAIAAQMANAELCREGDSEVTSFLDLLRTQRLDGYIQAADLQSIVQTLPIGATRRTWFLQRIGQELEFPHAKCSLAEIQSAYVAGVIDLSNLQSRLQTIGYSDDDQDIIVNLTLLKLTKEQYTSAQAQWTWIKTAVAAAKAGLPQPPKPPGIT